MTKAEQIIEDFKKSGKGIGTISNGTHYIECKEKDLIDLISKVIEDEKLKILEALEEEDDWLEMHKVENRFDSGKIIGLQRAIRIIKNY